MIPTLFTTHCNWRPFPYRTAGSRATLLHVCVNILFLSVAVDGQQFIPVSPNPNSWWSKHFPGQPDRKFTMKCLYRERCALCICMVLVSLATLCPVLLGPGNGTVDVRDGGIAKGFYSCNTNYTLVGDDVVRCVCGEWTGRLAVCRRGESLWHSAISFSRHCI